MANCKPGECSGDPTYESPIVVPSLPSNGDGGHEFVTTLPDKGSEGVEYVLMEDISDCSTYQGTYVWNSKCGTFVETSGSGGGGTIERYTFENTSTGWRAKRNNTVIFTYVDKDTIDGYEDTADGFQIVRGGSVIFTHKDKGGAGSLPEYTAENTATGWVLKKDGVAIFTYVDKNDEYIIESTVNGWDFKENGVVKFSYTEPTASKSDGTYFTSGTLTTVIGGTTTIAASAVTGLTVADVVLNETLIYDEFGSLGRVTAVNGNNLTVETVTTAPGERRGVRLGAVDTHADLPATTTAATALGWQTPIQGDYAYIREDETHDDHLTEWVIQSIDNSGNITWAYSHTLNAGNYVSDIYEYGQYPSGNPIPKNADGSVTLPKDQDTTYDFETTTLGDVVTGWRVKDHDSGTVIYTYTDQDHNDNTEYDFEDVTSGGKTIGWRVKNHGTGVVLFTHTDVGDTTYDFESVTVGGEIVGWRVKDHDTGTVLFTYNDRSDVSDGSYLTSDTLSTTITGTSSVLASTVSGLTVADIIDGETLIYDGAGTVGVVTSHTSTTLTVSTMTISGSGDASSFVYTTTETLPDTVGSTQTLTRTALKRSDDSSVPALADLIVGKTLVSDKFGSVAVITDITGTTITGTVVTVAGGGIKAGVTWASAKLSSDWTASAGTIPFVNRTGSTISQPANGQWTIPAGMTVQVIMSIGLMGSSISNGEWGVREVGSSDYILRVDPYDHSGASGWALNGTASGIYTNTSSTDKVIYAECISVQQACKIYAVTSQITVVEVARSGANIIAADNVYSTDEQLVGSYLGKPLYKKTLVIPQRDYASNVDNTFTMGLSNVESVTKIEGTTYRNGYFCSVTEPHSATQMVNAYYTPADDKLHLHFVMGYAACTVRATLWYTKTSDAANSAPNKNSLLLTRPDLWTAGVEYDFGGGLYGKRLKGTAAFAADSTGRVTWNTTVCTGVATTAKVINKGGMVDMSKTSGTNWYDINGSWNNGTTTLQQSVAAYFLATNTSNQIKFYGAVNNGAGNYQYDVWFTYTKA